MQPLSATAIARARKTSSSSAISGRSARWPSFHRLLPTWMVLVVTLVFVSGSSSSNSILFVQAQPSGCEVCASTGSCQAAFKGQPGHFCGFFYAIGAQQQRPCCCPLTASCKLQPNACLCHVSGNNGGGSYHHHAAVPSSYSNSHAHRTEEEEAGIGSFFVFLAVVVACCCCFRNQNRDSGGPSYPVAATSPFSETTPLAPPSSARRPPAMNPNYQPSSPYGATTYATAPSAVHHHYTNDTPRGGGPGGWLSGIGGFLTGAGLGSLATHQWDQHHMGGGGGGREYYDDVQGDTGGGYDGGYDIQGDTGGGGDDGGYDFAGDS